MQWLSLLQLLVISPTPIVTALSSLIQSQPVPIIPARQPLPAYPESFSLLSWNILLPNSLDNSNWWCHKQYASWVDPVKREWSHRHALIQERLLHSDADIICLQEADGETFEKDFRFLQEAGYEYALHKKFRFRCATFYKADKYTLEQVAHKDRTLVTALQCQHTSKMLNLVNCHLSGGAAPERRLRQVHEGLNQIRKWRNARQQTLNKLLKAGNREKDIAKATQALLDFEQGGILVVGDFNSDGQTAVQRLLVEGGVDPDWHEPQYPTVQLTSKLKQQMVGKFVDAAELAYQSNVCDGDYGDLNTTIMARPATYVVPNLASLLLKPIPTDTRPPRTEFGPQVAKSIAEALHLIDFCDLEMDRAFDQVDEDGNGEIDAQEVQLLLEQAYVATYGPQMEQERNTFFRGFGQIANLPDNEGGLTKDQFIARLKALQQDREGEQKAFGLAKGLDLNRLDEIEMEKAFDRMDLDGNGLLDEDEYQQLLETVYVTIYGKDIEKQRTEFFTGFQDSSETHEFLSKEHFRDRLLALHQELEGGRKGSQLAEVRTEADANQVVDRFTPLLQTALDKVFNKLSGNRDTLTQEEVNEFLIRINGVLGRGGTFRHMSSIFSKKEEASQPVVLTRQDWYGVFARELSEGKWWQVVYDLELCGAPLRSQETHEEHYQAWLDYLYFDSERFACEGVQDVLTPEERSHVYTDGNALPNEWHPSDHLPVAAVFSWK